MPLIATVRQSDGPVLCAYPLKPKDVEADLWAFTGSGIIENDGRVFVIHTIIAEVVPADWEADGHMPCSECGSDVPWPGWETWTECPTCGARVRPTHHDPSTQTEDAQTTDAEASND
jgi:hypothetical protein